MGGLFELDKLNNRLNELNLIMKEEDFWQDINNANNINKEYSSIKKVIDNFNDLNDEIDTLNLLKDELDENSYLNEYQVIENKLNELEKITNLNGEYDDLNCYLELHPGAGGTESCDWSSMLLRMYERYCDANNFNYEVVYEQSGEEAGIKSATILIKGEYAYGYLKHESGVHRLVRLSPFDASHRRHTSFASVTVTPEFKDTPNIEIKESDLKIDVYHSSGAGGQSVNTSNSAVRITHLPSKIVVTCQNERSQLKNKDEALKLLKNKLYEKYLKEEIEKKSSFKNDEVRIDFASQIRNYVLEPYKLVKDLRSEFESNEPDKILNGEIKDLLEYNLKNIK